MDREETKTQTYSWLADLEGTLNSPEGSKALESYLIHCDSISILQFIWACDGLTRSVEENPNKADDLVTCIFKNYIISGVLPMLSDHVVEVIAKHFEDHFERPEPSDFSAFDKANQPVPLNPSIFDDAKAEVETFLETHIFPQFQNAVRDGEVYVGVDRCNSEMNRELNGCSATVSARLAGNHEAFARKLCEKLESLLQTRESKPP